jgi:hypothetical protein
VRYEGLAAAHKVRVSQFQAVIKEQAELHESYHRDVAKLKADHEKASWAMGMQVDRLSALEQESRLASEQLPKLKAGNPRLFG